MTNVLPAAFIVLATYALIALGKSIIPGFSTLPNNGLRAIGYVLCYAMAAVNLMVQQAVQWQDLWGLLPVAGALFATASLLYHIGTDGPAATTTGAQTLPSVPLQGPVTISVSGATTKTAVGSNQTPGGMAVPDRDPAQAQAELPTP
jgi:hypothetical protein